MTAMWGRIAVFVVAGLLTAAAAAAAPEPVTIQAHGPFALQGRIASSQAGQIVTIQAKDCGVYPQVFRDVAEAHTFLGGGWSIQLSTGVTSAFRAVWNGQRSKPVTVWQRPLIRLQPVKARHTWIVTAVGKTAFWRKRVRYERWDRFRTEWKLVRWVSLTETNAPAGATFANTSARFRAPVPKSSLVRAVLPRAQARPCYLAGYSKQFRT
jgi:hypothetical protein